MAATLAFGLGRKLLALNPTPVVALNRAVAVSEVHGAAALSLVDALDLGHYHATRADLLRRLGRDSEAAAAYERAAALAPTCAEREFLARGGRRGPLRTHAANENLPGPEQR